MASKFLVKKTNTGYNFLLVATNGQPVGASQVYKALKSALAGVESVKTVSATAEVEDQTQAEVEEKKRIQQMIKDSKSITAAQLGKDLPDIQDLADRLIPEIVKLSIDKVQISLEATKIAIKYDGSSLAITRTDVKRQKDEAHR